MTDNNDKVFLGEASFSQKEGSVGSNPTPRTFKNSFKIVLGESALRKLFALNVVGRLEFWSTTFEDGGHGHS